MQKLAKKGCLVRHCVSLEPPLLKTESAPAAHHKHAVHSLLKVTNLMVEHCWTTFTPSVATPP